MLDQSDQTVKTPKHTINVGESHYVQFDNPADNPSISDDDQDRTMEEIMMTERVKKEKNDADEKDEAEKRRVVCFDYEELEVAEKLEGAEAVKHSPFSVTNCFDESNLIDELDHIQVEVPKNLEAKNHSPSQ